MVRKENPFLSLKQEQKIVEAIQAAEKNTSGEIRVHIEFESSTDHFQTALEVFNKLGMHQTKERNAVLFHVAPYDRNFTIIGDEGIDQVTPDDFWEEIKNVVVSHFKDGKHTKGLCVGIEMAGEALKKYFPYQEDDQNEISDEISYS
ncbi:TPM domain-containing protein [Faecalibacter bovis]|uniref:TPM domain-containing protein n=1 Tax=Faecalibacter bovis TaxID=2898187 RepID=A0ABX7XDV8_9FLAO|nr:TPM domain-containing protein [Faecalibacter bovis]QTV06024.1 TPM domain-containing protein [Faecalibacter bovis]